MAVTQFTWFNEQNVKFSWNSDYNFKSYLNFFEPGKGKVLRLATFLTIPGYI